ncbi:MAG: hypothetical protein K0R48_1115 [Gammaproteobacteria bacterium]|jgi:uncharacterized membrane protein YhaH (DUF805 family)|nr:hypothetical protein [Gammaproteobacteria bacterium]
MDWYLKVLQNYAVFSGRARRKEYWYFILFNTIVTIFLSLIDFFLFSQSGLGIFCFIYGLAVLIPSFAVFVRRLHDTGRSAWWLLWILIPLIGGIVLLVVTVLDSEPGANRYGPNPK